MDRHQQYGTRVKSEDEELGIWVPVKQEREPTERAPGVVPKVEPSGETIATSNRPENAHNQARECPPSTRKRRRGPRAKKPPKRVRLAEKLRKAEEMNGLPGNEQLHQERDDAVIQRAETLSNEHQRLSTEGVNNTELRNSRIYRELSDARKMIADLRARSQVSAPKKQASPPHQVPESTAISKQASTITALRAEISRLEQQLKEACRDGENAIRDARAFQKNNIDAGALERQLAIEQAKNRAMVSRLQKALRKQQDKSDGAHSGLPQVVEQEVGMTGWPGYAGGQIVKIEDADMEYEDDE
ncbi:hypothetical protein BKA58DRAFT_401713 [Alternaria rosae]|uniref:uncharacterized protein n=1 Tax=Alternaria rosae TaxID=1187941 RepID=UPI001E8EDB40|nr:uncharacterized protein BKA58DRAFT_401713 [Alternaria rosae]KAH6870146.1 hypothetical protein BKA58DRAFT_401713 [Alternaria rosae]